jgi:hypothetical protein
MALDEELFPLDGAGQFAILYTGSLTVCLWQHRAA